MQFIVGHICLYFKHFLAHLTKGHRLDVNHQLFVLHHKLFHKSPLNPLDQILPSFVWIAPSVFCFKIESSCHLSSNMAFSAINRSFVGVKHTYKTNKATFFHQMRWNLNNCPNLMKDIKSTLEKTEAAIMYGQSIDSGNTRHTRHRMKTIHRQWQHQAHKTQDEDNP